MPGPQRTDREDLSDRGREETREGPWLDYFVESRQGSAPISASAVS
jgi:hypothetical protein